MSAWEWALLVLLYTLMVGALVWGLSRWFRSTRETRDTEPEVTGDGSKERPFVIPPQAGPPGDEVLLDISKAIAPFLALLSQHRALPDGSNVRCSCGATLYHGHLARVLAQRFEPRKKVS
jgi:hypothetical protein